MNAYLEEVAPYLGIPEPRDWPTEVADPDTWVKGYVQRTIESIKHRGELRFKYAFAVPNDEAIAAIAKLSPIVEMGAGNGYWASLLSAAGADVIAYDDMSWYASHAPVHFTIEGQWFPVMPGEPADLQHVPDRNLFLCWPPHGEPMAFKSLRYFEGEYVAYIGEYAGGTCADDRFFEYLSGWFDPVEEVSIPHWPGMHDYLSIWHRRERRR